jgi:hypothetical protein
MRWALPLLVLLLIVLGGQQAQQPSTARLIQAVRELGPISGWRCAASASYTYDPRHDSGDTTLLADAPEHTVTAVVVDRVEVNLRGGDTTLWTHVPTADGAQDERRVYVLTPGQLRAIAASEDNPICYSHLGNWRIIAEHRL